jgi:hypothetical protein
MAIVWSLRRIETISTKSIPLERLLKEIDETCAGRVPSFNIRTLFFGSANDHR